MKKMTFFFNFNTDSRISLCARAHRLRYVEVKLQGHRIGFSGFINIENSDFAEFKVNLIRRKQVPLLHNTSLIVCDEGAGFVAV